MQPSIQVRLLRVHQEGEYERVGGTSTIAADARIIAATDRDIEQEVAAGPFRTDLFYRLKVIRLTVPPLREPSEDIPLLAQHFLVVYSRKNGKDVRGFTPEALDAMRLSDRAGGPCVDPAQLIARALRFADALSEVADPSAVARHLLDLAVHVIEAAAVAPLRRRCLRWPHARGSVAEREVIMAEDEVYFEHEKRGIRITKTQARFGGTTYPVNGLVFVRTKKKSVGTNLSPLFVIGGAIAVAVGLIVAMAGASVAADAVTASQTGAPLNGASFGGLGAGVVILLVGAVSIFLGWQVAPKKPRYLHTVVLGTGGGDKAALSTPDGELATSVSQALERAIAARG